MATSKRARDLDTAALHRVMNILAEEEPAGSPAWNAQAILRGVLERRQRDDNMAASLKTAKAARRTTTRP